MRRIGNSNLFVMPAGQAVINPLELLHLKEVRRLMDRLRNAFRWILLDSPRLLVASDANLLAALADGTLLVARMGVTTPGFDEPRHRISRPGQHSGHRSQRDFAHRPQPRGRACAGAARCSPAGTLVRSPKHQLK